MAEETEAKAKKALTAEDFITKWPLYTPFDFVEYRRPDRISFYCPNEKCSKETTWMIAYTNSDIRRFVFVDYQCTLCGASYLSILYRTSKLIPRKYMTPSGEETHYVSAQIQKVGQFPPLSIDIPKLLEKNLGGTDAALYKKALTCRNRDYGLGAVSYIRRVVEDKTEELIEVVAELAESHKIDPKTVAAIRAAKVQKTTYDEKLRIASAVIPESLLIEGVNPLEVLYGLVSAGLHDLSEEKCIEIADEGKAAFEYTFANLRAETDGRKDFANSIKKLERKLSALKTPKTESAAKISAEPSE